MEINNLYFRFSKFLRMNLFKIATITLTLAVGGVLWILSGEETSQPSIVSAPPPSPAAGLAFGTDSHSTVKVGEGKTMLDVVAVPRNMPPKVRNQFGMEFVVFAELDIGFGAHEVTREQYGLFASASGDAGMAESLKENGNHPVTGISWEAANRFCDWLSKKDGRLYRLPTDYEWSIAAGMKPETGHLSPMERAEKAPEVFFWGGQWPPVRINDNFADLSVKESKVTVFNVDDGFPRTAPVGTFTPNRLGIHDLGGNVREWVYDWYRSRDEFKTIRGASCETGIDNRHDLSVGGRGKGTLNFSDDNLGFRLVVEKGDDVYPPSEVFIVNSKTEATLSLEEGAFPSQLTDKDFPSEPERMEIRVLYAGSKGLNVRERREFESDAIVGTLHKQNETSIFQIEGPVQDDDVTWVKVEITGWMPIRVGKFTFLEKEGESQWRVTWNKPGDRYVAMRSGPSSDHDLVSRVHYDTLVEELDSKSVGNRDYIHARYTAWAVKKNRVRTYLSD